MQAIHTNLPGAVVATARLQLKELTPETLSTILTTYSDEGIMQCLGLVTSDELALEKHKFAQGLTMYRISFKHFLIIESTTGNVIGRIGYHWWHVPHSRAEIGYALAADEHKGKGYMTEAIRAVVAYGFNVMGLNRIEAFIGSRNEPSLRLVQRLGFTREGLMREHYCKNEVIEDSVCFSLLKREFVSK